MKKYESEFLGQKQRFLNAIKEHFKKHALRHSQQMYDRMMREYENGKEIEVYVFFWGNFEKERLSKQIINS